MERFARQFVFIFECSLFCDALGLAWGVKQEEGLGLVSKTFNHILKDIAWLQSLLSSYPSSAWLASCDEYDYDAIISHPVPESLSVAKSVPEIPEIPDVSSNIKDIYSSLIFDSLELDWSETHIITWILFIVGFIFTLIYCLSTMWRNDEDHIKNFVYRPRNKPVCKEPRKVLLRKQKRQSISPSRRDKLKKKRPIPTRLIERQLHNRDGNVIFSKDSIENDIFRIRNKLYRGSVRKISKSSLEILRRPKSRNTSFGKMYDLDDAENIPWEILDVLLCIQSPCYKHDHDHVCVIGNHVYTIPHWNIPNTTYLSDTPSPSVDIGWESSSEDDDGDIEEDSYEEYDYNYYKDIDDDDKDSDDEDNDADDDDDSDDKDSDDEIDEDDDGLGFYHSKVSPKIYDYKTFVPIDPAIPDGLHFNESDNIKLNEPIIDITEAIGSESCDIGENGDVLNEKPEPQTVKERIFAKTVEVKENVKNVFENVYETGKTLVENIYPSIPNPDPETTGDQNTESPNFVINSVLNEDDIGQPCANSSFKTELNNKYRTNLETKQCFTSDENDLSWVEDDSTYFEEIRNLQSEIISPRSRPSFNEVDFNLSQHLHDLSMRLSKDSHDIHDLNKTLSFYGELSPFELGASWLVRSLLNHVIDQLNISERADSLLEDISDRVTSILNNSR